MLEAMHAIAVERDAAAALEWFDGMTRLQLRELVAAYPWPITDREVASRLGWSVRQVKAARGADPEAFATDEARRHRPTAAACAVLAAIADALGIPRSRMATRAGVDPRRIRPDRGPVYGRALALIRDVDAGS